jgi:hypothetical protein
VATMANPGRPVQTAAMAVKSAAEDMSQSGKTQQFLCSSPDRGSLSGFYSVLVYFVRWMKVGAPAVSRDSVSES